jgi:hypothetical protein
VLYTLKGCMAENSEDCVSPTSPYYETADNGLDTAMKVCGGLPIPVTSV